MSMTAKPARAKVPAFDAQAIARAEAALQALSNEFGTWMEEEVVKLEAAFAHTKGEKFASVSLDALHTRAHDVKGLGATYEFPLITRLAGALCRLLETPERRGLAAQNAHLIGAAVGAIRASIRDNIRNDQHAIGRVLAAELDASVDRALAETAHS